MLIDLTADEIARVARLLHLADDAADAQLWEKIKEAHIRCVVHPPVNAQPCGRAKEGLSHGAHTWYSHAHVQPCGDVRVCGEARECPGFREVRQTCAEGLTPEQSAVAYRRVKERFELTAAQRAKLDVSPLYSEILVSAHNNLWSKCAVALMRAEIRSW